MTTLLEPATAAARFRNDYAAFQAGETLSFALLTLRADGSLQEAPQSFVIKESHTGGFFGRVLIPETGPYVVKTALPDPWHHLWRSVNWRFKPFPAQTEERAAQLEHLSTRLVHAVLPVLTDGKYRCPASHGYARLATGYAQIIERLDGRGPRFDLATDELAQFRQAQRELLALGTRLGLEQVGQVHPDNPFGLANLWIDDSTGKILWLDTLAAIPHNGWIWPSFYFRFHRDIRRRFGQRQATFNQIHTALFRAEIARNRGWFSPDAYAAVLADLDLYDRLWPEWQARLAALQPDAAAAANALKVSAIGALQAQPVYRFVTDQAYRRDMIQTASRIGLDAGFREHFFNKHLTLAGVEQARREGIIRETELQLAWQTVETVHDAAEQRRRKVALVSLQAYFLATAYLINALEASAYFSLMFVENKNAVLLLAILIGWVLPSVVRLLGTVVMSGLARTNLVAAAKIAVLPKLGTYLAVPAQIGVDVGNESGLIWHYAVREFVATLSKMSPSGGWGTQLEAQLWETFGTRLERWGKASRD